MASERCGCDVKFVDFKYRLEILSNRVYNILEWMPDDFVDGNLALVEIIAVARVIIPIITRNSQIRDIFTEFRTT